MPTVSTLAFACPRVLVALIAVAALAGAPVHAQTPAPSPAARAATLANPASTNCADKGGSLQIEKNPKGGQFGVCLFPDNLQCEEWAMMRGDCRAGGIKVTGYVTPAARYCAITGGTYKVVAAGNTPAEQGNCTFRTGKTCNAGAYFEGTCSREPNTRTVPTNPVKPHGATAAKTIQARFACDDGKTVDATFINGATSSVKLVLSDGRTLSLQQAMSASGARYANADESVVFWNKGNTAFIEERGKTTYTGCTTA